MNKKVCWKETHQMVKTVTSGECQQGWECFPFVILYTSFLTGFYHFAIITVIMKIGEKDANKTALLYYQNLALLLCIITYMH